MLWFDGSWRQLPSNTNRLLDLGCDGLQGQLMVTTQLQLGASSLDVWILISTKSYTTAAAFRQFRYARVHRKPQFVLPFVFALLVQVTV